MNVSTAIGHNETTIRLAALAGDARIALDRVAQGEADTIDGWIAYGAALNEGRSLFPGDKEFGEWLRSSNLEEDIHPAEQSAAMWAAANRDQFEEARAAGNARTVRGIHAKWKEMEAFRLAQEMLANAFVEPDPEPDFEEQVESPKPPTLSQLAQQGVQRREPAPQPETWLQGRDPKAFSRALHFTALVTEYARDLSKSAAVEILPHLDDGQRLKLRNALREIDAIHDQIATRI